MRYATLAALTLVSIACGGGDDNPAAPSPVTATVRIRYQASTTPRTDLPPSLNSCVNGVGATHIHPSWRSFLAIPLTAVPPDRWEITFTDVPVDTRLSFRISDGNACDQNPTGAATQNIHANDVLLTQIVTTPGSGPEPGLAFTVNAAGVVTP